MGILVQVDVNEVGLAPIGVLDLLQHLHLGPTDLVGAEGGAGEDDDRGEGAAGGVGDGDLVQVWVDHAACA